MTNRRRFPAYVLPYAVYVALAFAPLGREWVYALRLVLVGGLLAWAWRRLAPLRGPGSPWASAAAGAAAGLLGTAVWVALLRPFAAGGGEPWSPTAFWLRVAAAGLLVPVFEEQLMRGFVLRVTLQWEEARRARAEDPLGAALDDDLARVAPGAASVLAVAVSTVAFALGHAAAEMPAAVAYGLLMAGLWILRRDLLACVVAHGVTNVALALYVKSQGAWSLW